LSTNAGGVFTGVAPPTRQKVNHQMLYAKAKPPELNSAERVFEELRRAVEGRIYERL
jgi:hypothetical protein